MITRVKIFVEEDFVGEMRIKQNPREYWQNFIDAAGQDPTLVLINKNNQNIPSEGMSYIDGNFITSEDSNYTFINNNINIDFERFAFIVNNVYVASHDVSRSTMPNVMAAYQSNPSFIVSTEELTY